MQLIRELFLLFYQKYEASPYLSRNFTILAYNYMYLHIKTLPLKVNYILPVLESPFQLQIPMILIFFPPFLWISIFFFELNKVGCLYHRVCYKGLLCTVPQSLNVMPFINVYFYVQFKVELILFSLKRKLEF